MSEKRKYMRFNVFLDAFCGKREERKKIKVDNYSGEGLGIVSNSFLPEGENIEIEMTLPGDNIPVTCEGRVAWAGKGDSGTKKYRSGLLLKKMDNADRSKILNHIYERWIRSKEKK